MTDRTSLALAACSGLSDAELADRGPQGFKKMIERKRKYAHAARTLVIASAALEAQLSAAQARIAQLEQQVATYKAIEKLDAPVEDTSQAADMLASISKK